MRGAPASVAPFNPAVGNVAMSVKAKSKRPSYGNAAIRRIALGTVRLFAGLVGLGGLGGLGGLVGLGGLGSLGNPAFSNAAGSASC